MPYCAAIRLNLEDSKVLGQALNLLVDSCSLTGGGRTRAFRRVPVYGRKLRLQFFNALS